MSTTVFNVLFVGDSGAGKSTFLRRILTGEYSQIYEPTETEECHTLNFCTDNGDVSFNVCEIGGEKDIEKDIETHHLNISCFIVFFDEDLELGEKWASKVTKTIGNIPHVLCNTKSDMRASPTNNNYTGYYNVSAKTKTNLHTPFLHLARELLQLPNMKFIEKP